MRKITSLELFYYIDTNVTAKVSISVLAKSKAIYKEIKQCICHDIMHKYFGVRR